MSEIDMETEEPTQEPKDETEKLRDQLHQAKVSLAMMMHAMNLFRDFLVASDGRMTPDRLKNMVKDSVTAQNVAFVTSPWEDLNDIHVEIAKCRTCGKLTPMDMDAPQYCIVCARTSKTIA